VDVGTIINLLTGPFGCRSLTILCGLADATPPICGLGSGNTLSAAQTDSTITSAVLDRLLHHAETVLIEGSRAGWVCVAWVVHDWGACGRYAPLCNPGCYCFACFAEPCLRDQGIVVVGVPDAFPEEAAASLEAGEFGLHFVDDCLGRKLTSPAGALNRSSLRKIPRCRIAGRLTREWRPRRVIGESPGSWRQALSLSPRKPVEDLRP
jgi:hypothetical protein